MEYPGLDVRSLTDDQLQKKITEVSTRLSRVALRADVATQLRSMLESLRSEYFERSFRKSVDNDPKWKPGSVLNTDEDKEEENPFDKLINIG